MVVDTSALCAILFGEASRREFLEILSAPGEKAISSVTALEFRTVVMGRFGADRLSLADELLGSLALVEVPFDQAQGRLAAEASARYGKGRHPAGLNFGDCASYALARVRNDELVFLGEDFVQTDVRPARG